MRRWAEATLFHGPRSCDVTANTPPEAPITNSPQRFVVKQLARERERGRRSIPRCTFAHEATASATGRWVQRRRGGRETSEAADRQLGANATTYFVGDERRDHHLPGSYPFDPLRQMIKMSKPPCGTVKSQISCPVRTVPFPFEWEPAACSLVPSSTSSTALRAGKN